MDYAQWIVHRWDAHTASWLAQLGMQLVFLASNLSSPLGSVVSKLLSHFALWLRPPPPVSSEMEFHSDKFNVNKQKQLAWNQHTVDIFNMKWPDECSVQMVLQTVQP